MSQGKADASPAPRFRVWGPVSALGLVTAVLVYAIDQGHKWWMLEVYQIAERTAQNGGRVEITSFFNLVMAWNKGVSYGMFAQHDDLGRFVLIGVSLVAVAALFVWMGNALTRLSGLAIGMIIGGALGNVTDRIVHGAVADFFHFHYAGYSWYIFNIADIAIVAGVIGLMLDWLRAPSS